MSCAHSSRPDANASACSQCAGFAPTISRRIVSLPVDLVDDAVDDDAIARVAGAADAERRAPMPSFGTDPRAARAARARSARHRAAEEAGER
jgi:hypothetical protein